MTSVSKRMWAGAAQGLLLAAGIILCAAPVVEACAGTVRPPTSPQAAHAAGTAANGGNAAPLRIQEPLPPAGENCEPMTAARMRSLITRLDSEARVRGNVWEFTVGEATLALVYDANADRMRLMLAVDDAAEVAPATMARLLSANFDTAMDARYAIARGTVWATYVHPLAALTAPQLLDAIRQVVNLRDSYGTSFSAGPPRTTRRP